jgi:GntR family transcriptional repressor for pyruvate dehydrogenase complex
MVEVMEARELIESQIAFMAAESADDKDVAALEEVVARQASAIEDKDQGVEENIGFHLSLARSTGNRVLVELQQIFFELSHGTISDLFHVPGRAEMSVLQHREILDAVKGKRPADAHLLMLEHLRSRYKRPGIQEHQQSLK